MGRSNENDVAYPLPVLGVRSTPFAGVRGKVECEYVVTNQVANSTADLLHFQSCRT